MIARMVFILPFHLNRSLYSYATVLVIHVIKTCKIMDHEVFFVSYVFVESNSELEDYGNHEIVRF